jgi:formylglycine-generating enzyme
LPAGGVQGLLGRISYSADSTVAGWTIRSRRVGSNSASNEGPEEKQAGRVYRLPTEAQWEWAARAGTPTSRYFGDNDQGQVEYSWFNHTYTPNPKHEADGRGWQEVGSLKPNAWGLYDILGNVWEWCGDRHVDAMTGEERQPVMRGGSWRSGAFHCTAVAQDPADPNTRADNIGFRVAVTLAGD